jgi:hypothetical protein
MRFRPGIAALVSALAIAACDRPSTPVVHETLLSLDPLRAAFNKDSGKVRAIFLASPT